MKIQVGNKGDVAWDTLLEALNNGNNDTESQHLPEENGRKSLRRRLTDWCFGGSWLTLAIVLSVVLVAQSWILLYFFLSTGTVYTEGGHAVFTDTQGKLRHVHFSWSNCGSKIDPVKVNQLRVSPDPVFLERNITLDLNGFLKENLDSPISAKVKVERRIGWLWVKIPCVAGLGSCHYEDVCQLVPFLPDEPCPDPFPRFNIPCRCPVFKGHYIITNGTFALPNSILNLLPGWLVSGDYYIEGTAYKKGNRLGCYTAYASVTH